MNQLRAWHDWNNIDVFIQNSTSTTGAGLTGLAL